MQLPPTDDLHAVLGALGDHGIDACLGGSALLAARGAVDVVHDWDVTTDAPRAAVEAALRTTGLSVVDTTGGGPYATEARFAVGDHVEVIVRFAIRVGTEVVALPSRPAGVWEGIPLADPAVWATAYRLLGRDDRAAALG